MGEIRSRFSPRRALTPILGLLDRSSKAACQRPEPAEDGTRFPEFAWDLRTIILLLPPEVPLRFLNLNLLLGLTGVPFDRIGRLGDLDLEDAFDLQFCLEGRARHATYKRYHSISRELSYCPEAVDFRLGDRLRFEGAWPTYRIQYRQPEADLWLSMKLDSWQDFHWWAKAPRLYCHYTSFADCRVEWQWGSESGVLDVPVLHDHGWGRNLLPFRVPLAVFRYEVLRIPSTPGQQGGFAVSLWTEGPCGMTLKQSGLLRRDRERRRVANRYECRVLEWDVFGNYAGTACRVPRRWLGRLFGSGVNLEYEAQRSTEPRAVLGNGFLCGFDYQGVSRGDTTDKLEGEGYAEQMGLLLR